VFFGVIELFSSKPYFRQFVVAKTFGLSTMIVVYIILRHTFSFAFNTFTNSIIALISIGTGFAVSYVLTNSKIDMRDLFIPGFFLLTLIFVMFFSFSVFPPQLPLFQDPQTGFYGIIPDYIDTGAVILNSLYS
jgi:hypothetical protein